MLKLTNNIIKSSRERNIFFIFLLAYIVLMIIFTLIHYHNTKEEALSKLDIRLNVVTIATNSIVPSSLHFQQEIDNLSYRPIIHRLNQLANESGIRYVYTLIQKEGDIFFTTTSETTEEIVNGELSQFGERYDDAPPILKEVFLTGKAFYSPIYTDKWGTFRSLFVPHKTPQGLYVIGADIEASVIDTALKESLWEALAVALFLLLPIIPALIIFKKYIRNREIELLRNLYTHPLTKLQNKISLSERLSNNSDEYAILILKLDNYHYIVGLYGFSMADEIILQTQKLLLSSLSGNATLYHVQDEQFAIFIQNPLEEQEIHLAQQLRGFFLNTSVTLQDFEIQISFTMGIARGCDENVLKKADAALNKANLIGKNRYEIYHEAGAKSDDEAQEILSWISKVKKALTNESIIPYYQPIMNLHTGKIEHFECLSRLIDEDQILNPYLFLEPAKAAGFLPYLTKAIVNAAFTYFSDKPYNFSINVTSEDLQDDFFCQFIKLKLARYNLEPCRVTCEILEDISLTEDSRTLETIKQLKRMGLKIAIDDFGTSYSNFSRLLSLEADYLKIDGAFIKNIDTDENSTKIVASIISFAQNAKIKTVAEFVHSQEIFDKLKEMGIDYVQGYYIGVPLRTIPE